MELQLIQSKIFEIRGTRVMLDRDLAELYQVSTSALNQAVKRNAERFPPEFMFQLSDPEVENWKSQIVITNSLNMGLRRNPYAFTEQGVAMLSAVLKSSIAIKVSINIMNAFVAMRQYLLTTNTATAGLAEIHAKLQLLERNDENLLGDINDLSEDMRREIADIYLAIGELSARPASGLDPNRRMIGFGQSDRDQE